MGTAGASETEDVGWEDVLPHIEKGVGEAIQEIRLARGLRREDLAARVGISPPYLSRIESGERPPRLELSARIAEALELPHGDLLLRAIQKGRVADGLPSLPEARAERRGLQTLLSYAGLAPLALLSPGAAVVAGVATGSIAARRRHAADIGKRIERQARTEEAASENVDQATSRSEAEEPVLSEAERAILTHELLQHLMSVDDEELLLLHQSVVGSQGVVTDQPPT